MEKARKRANRWAMLDYLEGRISESEIEKQAEKYCKQAKKTEKEIGFNQLTGKIKK